MKTVNDPTNAIDVPPVIREALSQLDEFTQNMPVDEMVKELHLIIERLTFHSNTSRRQRELGAQDIEALLGSDVSRSMFDFMVWSADHKLLKLFQGDAGQVFLSYCAKHYRHIGEVTVTTPVSLSDVFTFTISEQLRQVHPFPTRLIFRTEPSLVAGVVIKTSDDLHDYSLRKSMLSDISAYLRAQPTPNRKSPDVHEQTEVAPVSVAKDATRAPEPMTEAERAVLAIPQQKASSSQQQTSQAPQEPVKQAAEVPAPGSTIAPSRDSEASRG